MASLAFPVAIHLKIKIQLFIVISQWPYLYLTLKFSVSFDQAYLAIQALYPTVLFFLPIF